MKNQLLRIVPFLGLLSVYILFALICPPEFTSFYNLKTIITQTVIVAVAALGVSFIIIQGGIDLSLGSQIALGTVVLATSLNSAGPDPSVGAIALSILAAMAAVAFTGLANGLIISRARIMPFIVTLGMMQIARGIAKLIANEQTVPAPITGINQLTMVDPDPSWLIFAPSVWVAIILLLLTHVILKYTPFGRYTYAIGSNEKTAILCGIDVKFHKTAAYVVSALFVSIAAVFQFANLTVGDPTAAVGLELDIIAAVVIGGASLSGGEGNALGALLGALIMAVLRNGSNMSGVPTYLQEILIGAIIIFAVTFDKLKR